MQAPTVHAGSYRQLLALRTYHAIQALLPTRLPYMAIACYTGLAARDMHVAHSILYRACYVAVMWLCSYTTYSDTCMLIGAMLIQYLQYIQ